ncbi:hypothetical protein [Ferdinandcohnia sp. SAFN-114]|uniref:hypothetical protein n=1 Tax=Ferdinandcohnia sp. SAFN-114 TaxID=3387275 RepID=UPI003F7D939A
MKRILLAIGNTDYSKILRSHFANHSDELEVLEQEIMHHKYLDEIVELEKPDILLVHDYYLSSDTTMGPEREKEWITFIQHMRAIYDDGIRVVFLCERPKGDPFLSRLVQNNVLDIFNNNAIDINEMMEQLKDRPRYSRVSKFVVNSVSTNEIVGEDTENVDGQETESDEQTSDTESTPAATPTEKPQKVVIKNVIEKKVEKKVKVVNKNVVKRDYSIQIHNNTEKIVGIPVKKKLVMIGSPIARSGSTFISHILARTLTNMGIDTTYVESPLARPYTYDRFIGQQHSADYRSRFYQFSKYIDPKFKSMYDWNKEDVELICKHPTNEPIYEESDVAFETFVKVLFSNKSTVTIIDVGTDWRYELYQDVFEIADHAYFVIEPDIPFIQYLEESKEDFIEFLHRQIEHEKSFFLGNRFDKSVLQNELLKDLYEGKIITHFPVFNVQDVFQAQFDGIFLNDYKDYQKLIDPYLEPILEDILPKEFLKKHKKGTGFFKGLFNKKITLEKGEESTV